MFSKKWGVFFTVLFILVEFTYAEYDPQKDRIKELEKRIEDLECQQGFEICGGATFLLQGIGLNSLGGDPYNRKTVKGSCSMDLEMKKKLNDIGGESFIHLEAGEGEGIDKDIVMYTILNTDADNDIRVRLAELWYEGMLFGDKAVLTFGKLDPSCYFDTNDVAGDETTQFLSGIFRNNPAIELSDNTLGMRISLAPYDWLRLGYGFFDWNNDWEIMKEHLFHLAQINFMVFNGNYRLLSWYNNINHTRWDDPEDTDEPGFGLGCSFDQKLTDNMVGFARYGWQYPKVYNPIVTLNDGTDFSIEQTWSVGVQIENSFFTGRRNIAGFGLGYIVPSDGFKKTAFPYEPKSEGYIEIYCRFNLNENFSITPDFQFVKNAYGGNVSGDNDIIVYGLRTQTNF